MQLKSSVEGPHVNKDEIRKSILERRLQQSDQAVLELSKNIQESVIKSRFWPQKGRIGIYSPVKNEVRTHLLFQVALESGLHVYFPRVEQGIQFYEVNGPDDLVRGSWSILEPSMSCEMIPEDDELDLLVVPGVAFTKDCARVGYGRGFYDRYIANLSSRVAILGMAYDFQIVDTMPADQWDQALGGVVSEKRWILRDKS